MAEVGAEEVTRPIDISRINIPWGKWLMIAIAFITIAITTMGAVWAAATLVTSKADKDDLHVIQETLHEISTDVAVIKRVVNDAHGGD